MKNKPTILVVDDEPKICDLLSEIIKEEGYQVLAANNGTDAISLVSKNEINLVLLDLRLPDIDGIEVLKQIRNLKPIVPIVMISAFGTIKIAIETVKLGAYDFIEKPLEENRVLLTIKNALERERLEREVATLKADALERYRMIGTSQVMQRVYSLIDRAATTDASALVLGESGVGKELTARAIHNRSKRADSPFVKINCAAVPHELIESELFGYEKGAFTGAVTRKQGKFEVADEGTLFLDEVGDMSPAAQAKLLRFLQEGEFERVGGTKTIKVNVRVIAASNKNLKQEIKDKNFREDLYYRLNVINIYIPPLREHRDDIPLLVDYFMNQFCKEHGIPKKRIASSALNLLSNQPWPGNTRELRNVMERIVVLARVQKIEAQDLIPILNEESYAKSTRQAISLKQARDDFEREYILEVLTKNNWNMNQTAKSLDIERTNLYRKIKRLGIKPPA